MDLWDGLSLGANDRVGACVDPEVAVEQALPLQKLPWAHLHYPAIHIIHGFLAAEFGFVRP